MLWNFTQNGKVKLVKEIWWYFDNSQGDKTLKYSFEDVETLREKDLNGTNISSYSDFWPTIRQMVSNHSDVVNNKKGFVLGTQEPWLEAILLNTGASEILTVEYQKLQVEHPRIKAAQPQDVARQYLSNRQELLDFGATYSSLEHSGLGRYGDPLNPFGDLEAMAQAYCLTKPMGYFLLGVPVRSINLLDSYLKWNGMREYGKQRLKFLTANWRVLDVAMTTPGEHAMFLLQKTPNIPHS